ncbi:hydrolase [Sphingomonas sp. Leaf343]|nr:hydrolase [Sphingomonas sp. Leaf343]
MAAAVKTAAVASAVTIPGPQGPLAGTLLDAGKGAPVVVVISGSGPTDRDGNNPMGVTAASYRLLAEALAERGVSTLRIDKRGMFGSGRAVTDANAVTIADYAADAKGWAAEAARRTGALCAWLLGHSEGGLVALRAAQDPRGLCGVILIAAPGRPLGAVMREQLRANPANAPILSAALGAIDSLEAGRRVDPATLPPPLAGLFPAAVQGFLIDAFAQDPVTLAARIMLPVLIVQGDRDLQVSVDDARALAKADPQATLAIVPGVNHVLKTVGEGRAPNLSAYADPSLPVAPGVVDAVAKAVGR